MRANGKRAGEWPDDEYAKRRAKLSDAEANGLGWISLAEVSRDNRHTKPADGAGSGKSEDQAATVAGNADAAPETLKMDLGDD